MIVRESFLGSRVRVWGNMGVFRRILMNMGKIEFV